MPRDFIAICWLHAREFNDQGFRNDLYKTAPKLCAGPPCPSQFQTDRFYEKILYENGGYSIKREK